MIARGKVSVPGCSACVCLHYSFTKLWVISKLCMKEASDNVYGVEPILDIREST